MPGYYFQDPFLTVGIARRRPAWIIPSVTTTTSSPSSRETHRYGAASAGGLFDGIMPPERGRPFPATGQNRIVAVREITRVWVSRSTDRIARVAETFPPHSIEIVMDSSGHRPSLVPSPMRAMALPTTSCLFAWHWGYSPWPSAMTTEIPPRGRSITSILSPLSPTAYLFILAIPRSSSILPSPTCQYCFTVPKGSAAG